MLRTTLMTAAILSGATAQAEGVLAVNDQPFLELIGEIEGPDGYDDIVMGATSQPPKPVTQMTVREVLEYQRQLQLQGSSSTAVGRFQFIRKTLKWLVDGHDINMDQKFDRRTQNNLARILMNRCDFYEVGASEQRVGNCLARAWASLPVIAGDKAGRSYYGSVGANKAHTTRDEVLAVLRQRFEEEEDITPVRVAMSDPLPAIRSPGSEAFAERIPLESSP
ncbi:hypothetical protein KUV57_12705 [Epibacterium sp. DP7N7-1]|nr:hypothetical protein [Epibacterium sp. DP7N7-1]